MALGYPGSGPNNVGDYMISGIPWVTSSTLAVSETRRIQFPGVTRFITFAAINGDLRVGFTQNGVNGAEGNAHYFVVADGGTFLPSEHLTLDLRVKELFLTGADGSAAAPTFQIIAGLTTIPDRNFPTLTGSVTGSLFDGIG